MKSFIPKYENLPELIRANWKSGLTVALISIPLSISLSIASGAGPIPGVVTGIWATLLAAIFGSNNYNVIGSAGALATILFAATLSAPFGLGAAILPFIAITTGIVMIGIYALSLDRFLYYIPGSVMYGFATGVALSIATGELFDATGLSFLKRTGSFIGDISLYAAHAAETHSTALIVFAVFLIGILIWKRFVKKLPAVIPAAILGVGFGWLNATFWHWDLISLANKFGGIHGAIFMPIRFDALLELLSSVSALSWLGMTAATVALVAVLETLITAKIADRITHTQSSSRGELLGLALANIGSGIMGGLPATGVFIRTGANIKAGATHRTSSAVAAIATALIALVVLPLFGYIPMAVIAAILVNTAIGLIEAEKFREYWEHERISFVVMVLVAIITILKDAGTGVVLGAIVALLAFADSISHGRFDVIFNFTDGKKEERRGAKVLHIPHDEDIEVLTYSIAGVAGYIDAERHAGNLRHAIHSPHVHSLVIRLRNLFSLDHESAAMLVEAAHECERIGKTVLFSSTSATIEERLRAMPKFETLAAQDIFCPKTEEALRTIRGLSA